MSLDDSVLQSKSRLPYVSKYAGSCHLEPQPKSPLNLREDERPGIASDEPNNSWESPQAQIAMPGATLGEKNFERVLASVLNMFGWDNTLDTPDYILAASLHRTLLNYLDTQNAVKMHERGI